MNRLSTRGFSLVELAVVLVIFGLVLAFSVPAYQHMTTMQNLTGAASNIAAQVRLMRELAINTGSSQTMHFFYATPGAGDYHIHNGATMAPFWSLPRNITYFWGGGTSSVMTATNDGRINGSGMIILQDPTLTRDTVSVLASGMVLAQ